MLQAAADLTRDLNVAKPAHLLGGHDRLGADRLWRAACGDAASIRRLAAIAAASSAVLALYRAGSFIHEMSHIKPNAVPGFRLGWNVIVGIPLLVPSFMYEGVHNQHHASSYYGTVDDPEYLPLALMKPWTLPVFVLAALLAPVGHADPLRRAGAAVVAVSQAAQAVVVERYSGLADQSGVPPPRSRKASSASSGWQWRLPASIWAISLLAMVATGIIPLRAFLIFLAIVVGRRCSSIRSARWSRTSGRMRASR